MDNYRLQIIESIDEFLSLRDAWERLHQRANFPTVFNSWGWIYSNILSFDYKQICILILRDNLSENNLPVVIIPLSIYKKGLINHARIIGYETSDYNNFLIDKDFKSTHLFYYTIKEAIKYCNITKIIMNQIPTKYYSNSILNTKLFFNGLAIKKSTGSSTYFSRLHPDDYTNNISGKRRKKINSRIRRLEEINSQIVILNDISEDIFLEFFKHHIKKWGPESIFKNEKYRRFLLNICQLMNESNQLVFHVIFCDNQAISFSIGFKDSDRFYGYITAYNESYSGFSPGTILNYREYLYAGEEGLKYFDLLRGADDYKQTWSGEKMETLRMNIYSLSPIGCFKIFSDAVSGILKRIKRLMNRAMNKKRAISTIYNDL